MLSREKAETRGKEREREGGGCGRDIPGRHTRSAGGGGDGGLLKRKLNVNQEVTHVWRINFRGRCVTEVQFPSILTTLQNIFNIINHNEYKAR